LMGAEGRGRGIPGEAWQARGGPPWATGRPGATWEMQVSEGEMREGAIRAPLWVGEGMPGVLHYVAMYSREELHCQAKNYWFHGLPWRDRSLFEYVRAACQSAEREREPAYHGGIPHAVYCILGDWFRSYANGFASGVGKEGGMAGKAEDDCTSGTFGLWIEARLLHLFADWCRIRPWLARGYVGLMRHVKISGIFTSRAHCGLPVMACPFSRMARDGHSHGAAFAGRFFRPVALACLQPQR
jgi:hypothetical protein